jgi:DNA-binding transcriptional ArsR family regulator
MPAQIIQTLDPLRDLIRFRTSAIYELIIGIKMLFKPTRSHEAWAGRVHARLPAALLSDLSYLYQSFNEGDIYIELPVDYDDHGDVPGFFEFVRSLSDTDLLFYLIGRIISRGELANLSHNPESLLHALDLVGTAFGWNPRTLVPILSDLPAFRSRLADAWERYWEVFFREEVPYFAPVWESGLADRRRILEHEGGNALLEKTTGLFTLPSEVPAGAPIRDIVFIPIYLMPAPAIRFYGYGSMTILFDALYSEERRAAVENAREEATAIVRALGDETRLQILRLIALYDGRLHGKSIASRMGITPSAVSRHIKLLKEGKLIAEEQRRNTIVYRFRRDSVAQLSQILLNFLYLP